LTIEVRAAADRRGGDAYNRQLAQLRADAVSGRLRDAGVPAERISIRVSGEATAIYAEDDQEGLGFDRYVVLTFLPGESS
jgi:outer membrane protein OmpA-like peptidoglycan-associated protein